MPGLTRWFLRAAMVNLVAALLLGVLSAVPAFGALPAAWRPVYVHLLVLGWATQMIFGVAYWMFPRRRPLDLAAVPWMGWACFGALNGGMLVRAASEPMLASGSGLAAAGALLASALQLGAVVIFVGLAWPRVTAR